MNQRIFGRNLCILAAALVALTFVAGSASAQVTAEVEAEPVACFKQVGGSACDNYTDLSPECPDDLVSSDVCNQVEFNNIGFESSTSYSAICRMKINVPNEEGECVTEDTRDITMRCKDAEGAACKVKTATPSGN